MATEQTVSYKKATSDKSRGVALILCLIGFFGLAGLHEFYVGRTLWGILYLFTIGFLGLGTIISALAIALGNFKDNQYGILRTWGM